MLSPSGWRLLADVGGTNVRFARTQEAGFTDLRTWPIADYASFDAALTAYVGEMGSGCSAAAIAGAGPLDAGRIALTNNDWQLDTTSISHALGGAPIRLLNDLEAVALALPWLGKSEVEMFGAQTKPCDSAQAMLALNVGTGFGAAVAIPNESDWLACPSEAGHMALGAVNRNELAVLSELPQTPSWESILSGAGVVDLYRAVAAQRGVELIASPQPRTIFAERTSDPLARQTGALFAGFLGRAASDLVLATGSWGGVFFCGSVAEAWLADADVVRFRNAFIGTGRMSTRLAKTATAIIRHAHPALLALSRLRV